MTTLSVTGGLFCCSTDELLGVEYLVRQSEEEDASVLLEGSNAFEELLQASEEAGEEGGADTVEQPTEETEIELATIPPLDAVQPSEDETDSDPEDTPQPPQEVCHGVRAVQLKIPPTVTNKAAQIQIVGYIYVFDQYLCI